MKHSETTSSIDDQQSEQELELIRRTSVPVVVVEVQYTFSRQYLFCKRVSFFQEL